MQDTAIQFRGTIYENGYGLIAQKVMRDSELSGTAKLIYSYICSFAGADKDGDRSAFPGVKLMMKELGIKSDDTYYKHQKQLIQKGYITIEKQKREGKFSNNVYFIEAVPTQVKEENKPNPNYSGTAPHPNFSSTENSSSENSGTNSIRSNIISFKEEEEIKEAHLLNAPLIDFLQSKNESQETITEIINGLDRYGIKPGDYKMIDIEKQYGHMMKLDELYDFSSYFLGGIKRRIKHRQDKQQHQEQKNRELEIKQARGKKRQEELYYDWLAE